MALLDAGERTTFALLINDIPIAKFFLTVTSMPGGTQAHVGLDRNLENSEPLWITLDLLFSDWVQYIYIFLLSVKKTDNILSIVCRSDGLAFETNPTCF